MLRSEKSAIGKPEIIRGTLMSALPLLALGVVRLLVTSAVGYQVRMNPPPPLLQPNLELTTKVSSASCK